MAFLRARGKRNIFHIVYYDEFGTKKSFSTRTDKRSKAKKKLEIFEAQKTLGLPFEIYSENKPKRIIFSNAVKEFLLSRDGCAEATLKAYQSAVTSWIKIIGNLSINSYTPDHFKRFDHKLAKDKKAQATCANYSRHLFIIFAWLVKKKYLKENPITQIRAANKEVNPVPVNHYDLIRRYYFLKGQFKQLDLFTLTFLCAFRITEAINCCGEDFDIPNQIVHIRNAKGKRIDKIPMTEDIEEYLSQMDLHEGRLFDYASKDSVKSTWKTVNKFYDFKGNTIHGLRKARGTQLANAGVTQLFLQTFMRHTDYRTTKKYYIKINRDIMRKEINEKLRKD